MSGALWPLCCNCEGDEQKLLPSTAGLLWQLLIFITVIFTAAAQLKFRLYTPSSYCRDGRVTSLILSDGPNTFPILLRCTPRACGQSMRQQQPWVRLPCPVAVTDWLGRRYLGISTICTSANISRDGPYSTPPQLFSIASKLKLIALV